MRVHSSVYGAHTFPIVRKCVWTLIIFVCVLWLVAQHAALCDVDKFGMVSHDLHKCVVLNRLLDYILDLTAELPASPLSSFSITWFNCIRSALLQVRSWVDKLFQTISETVLFSKQ